jgi:sulfoxide reductase heme-binding subunit YedZ
LSPPPRLSPRLRRAALALACASPLLWLLAAFVRDDLGANPVERVTHTTGAWALRFLVLTLAVTPLRRATGWRGIAPWRRTLGLWTFAYALLHFATYALLDLGLDPGALGEDLRERPYIMLGFTAFTILALLAATSSRAAVRRLGGSWRKLHRLVYVAGVLAVLHFFWLVKADLREPAIYAALVTLLLGARLQGRLRARRLARS